MKLNDWWQGRVFQFVHQHNLVYNTCWEDPRLDRMALELSPTDRVLVITSAGCNALDYVLQEPEHVFAVDLNPAQNSLLELKLAAIRGLEYDDFFAMFGRGRVVNARELYADKLRPSLSPGASEYWDRHIDFFSGERRRSFYFRGSSGWFAWLVNRYIDRVARARDSIEAILHAGSIAEQQSIYESRLRPIFWTRFIRWILSRDTTLSLVGVPRPQREQVERHYSGGIAQFVEDSIETVFTRLSLQDNYFWRVYLTGEYSPDCCPEYLRVENFERLRGGLVDRISTHTASVTQFLTEQSPAISRFVLLDHMDWLSTSRQPLLAQEWQAIVDHATPDARLLWRSGGLQTDFVDRTRVQYNGREREVAELLHYQRGLADRLHAHDRVHTYGSFHIAHMAT
ncbi:S-adenosylmethionine--diacylglycerol 3-amino-3-carboxypropyl transferase [Planctomycetia bacterium]|nr:S-adenosylmethionine--diacylglycerol 3-amino-3-carboxypropyl transferase [Planctomycetia bacterium]